MFKNQEIKIKENESSSPITYRQENYKDSIKILQLEAQRDYKFKDKKWIILARSHSSFVEGDKSLSNERLEFLGDNVIKLILSDHLFTFSELNEGEMTDEKITMENNKKLAVLAKKLNLEKYLLINKGVQNISDNMLADFIESIVGAIYKDGGLESAREFVLKYFV